MTRINTPFGSQSTAAEVAEGVDLFGKRAIVTGAASGMVEATARILIELGAAVHAVDIRKPDLTGMAAHPKSELLVHILDPSRSVEGNFLQYSVSTTDGHVLNGLLAGEPKTSIDLLDAEGDEVLAGKALRKDEAAGKQTFLSLLGPSRAREQAQMLVAQAVAHLAGYGEEAELLRSLARYVIARDR